MNKKPFEDLVQQLILAARRDEFQYLSDKQLLRRYLRQRDEFALGELIHRHGAMVWAVCQRILGQRQDAEDVYQVTFLKLVRQAIFVQRYESAGGWLYTVARSAAIHVSRQRACEKRRAKMHEEGYTDPRDVEDLTDILDEEVGCLPEKCRSPIILCYLEGLTYEQAAQRVNISVPCLQRRLAEGRHRLHQRLSQRGIHLDAPMLVAELTSDLYPQQVPPRLMEKTLHMVRILTQSNGALEAERASSSVKILAQSALETWTLKAKLLLVLLLATLLIAGSGLITYSGWRSFRNDQPQEDGSAPANKAGSMSEVPETHGRSPENPSSF